MVVAALVIGAAIAPASATPLSSKQADANAAQARVADSEAKVQQTVEAYDAARRRVDRINAELDKTSAKLDKLVAKQDRLEQHLAVRAGGMYRSGPAGFIEVLGGSATFEEFTAKWDMLARLGRLDALAIADLKETRTQVAATAKDLMKQQKVAAAELRKIETAKANAEQQLSSNRALFVSYKKQVAALESQEAAKRKAAAAAAKASSSSSSGGTSSNVSQKGGSGGWKSALCSMYGPDQIGEPLAGGGRLGADSMIVAHKTLPFGTLVEFRYHGRKAVAEVRDRGPYYGAREFDLGLGVARVLGFDGVGTVEYRIVD